MNKGVIAFIITFLLLATTVRAEEQVDSFWEQYLIELYENSDEAAMSMEEAYEHLQSLTLQPLDINTVETEELQQIPGLETSIISDIIEYRERYGRFRSVGELVLIPSIDNNLRRYLSSFFCVRDTSNEKWYSREGIKASLHDMRHSILLTGSVPTYYRAGDKGASSGSSGNKYANSYLGYPLSHSIRYSLSVGKGITLNLTGANTAGEPFLAHRNTMGYDTYAYNIVIKDLGMFHRIILGKYRAQFGMGLTMNNNLSFGKEGMIASASRMANVFTPHSSSSDSKHLQGIAATADVWKIRLSAFWSYRDIDATLNKDGTISTILTTGYHRTEKEMEKKNNAGQLAAGAHAEYSNSTQNGIHYSIGASFVYSWLNRPMNPTYTTADSVASSKMYRLFYPHGNAFWNASANYSVQYNDLSLTGETATGNHGQIATINMLSWSIGRMSLCAVQRYYAAQYYALYGSSFSSGGSVQNESGVYLGVRYTLSSKIRLEAYGDYAYYPWLKYLVSQSSNSLEGCLTGIYSPDSHWTLSARYRIKKRQRDVSGSDGSKVLSWRTDHHFRVTAVYDDGRWNIHSQLEGCLMQYARTTKGFILSQSVGYKPTKRIDTYLRAAYFHTGTYDSRLYSYERGMTYSFGYSSYYGHGMRLAAMVKTKISRLLTACVKAGYTKYFDRSTIGSAEREIFSSHQTDIDFQLQVKL